MTPINPIPDFALLGEQESFPDVVHCETFSARAPIHGWHIPVHRHAHLAQLFVIKSGWVEARVDDLEQEFASGDFLYIPPKKAHRFAFKPDTEGNVVSFPVGTLKSLSPGTQELQATLSQTIFGKASDELAAVIAQLAQAAARQSPFRAQKCTGLAHSVLGVLAELSSSRHTGPGMPSSGRLVRLDQLIANNAAEGWTASDYANALSMSTGHLSRLCRRATGLGAAAYVEHFLMDEACRMLAFTQLPVSEIGFRLGFGDPSYFSRRFRSARKSTPTEYRRQFLD